MTLRQTLAGLMLLVLSVTISGCGARNTQAPPTGSITIKPTSISWAVSVLPATYTYESELMTVAVSGSNGLPLAGVYVTLTLDLSSSTSTSPVMNMYTLNPLTNPTTAVPLSSPVELKTDNNGNVVVWIYMATGNGVAYKGYLNAVSGALSTQASITVTCTPSGGTTCP